MRESFKSTGMSQEDANILTTEIGLEQKGAQSIMYADLRKIVLKGPVVPLGHTNKLSGKQLDIALKLAWKNFLDLPLLDSGDINFAISGNWSKGKTEEEKKASARNFYQKLVAGLVSAVDEKFDTSELDKKKKTFCDFLRRMKCFSVPGPHEWGVLNKKDYAASDIAYHSKSAFEGLDLVHGRFQEEVAMIGSPSCGFSFGGAVEKKLKESFKSGTSLASRRGDVEASVPKVFLYGDAFFFTVEQKAWGMVIEDGSEPEGERGVEGKTILLISANSAPEVMKVLAKLSSEELAGTTVMALPAPELLRGPTAESVKAKQLTNALDEDSFEEKFNSSLSDRRRFTHRIGFGDFTIQKGDNERISLKDCVRILNFSGGKEITLYHRGGLQEELQKNICTITCAGQGASYHGSQNNVVQSFGDQNPLMSALAENTVRFLEKTSKEEGFGADIDDISKRNHRTSMKKQEELKLLGLLMTLTIKPISNGQLLEGENETVNRDEREFLKSLRELLLLNYHCGERGALSGAKVDLLKVISWYFESRKKGLLVDLSLAVRCVALLHYTILNFTQDITPKSVGGALYILSAIAPTLLFFATLFHKKAKDILYGANWTLSLCFLVFITERRFFHIEEKLSSDKSQVAFKDFNAGVIENLIRFEHPVATTSLAAYLFSIAGYLVLANFVMCFYHKYFREKKINYMFSVVKGVFSHVMSLSSVYMSLFFMMQFVEHPELIGLDKDVFGSKGESFASIIQEAVFFLVAICLPFVSVANSMEFKVAYSQKNVLAHNILRKITPSILKLLRFCSLGLGVFVSFLIGFVVMLQISAEMGNYYCALVDGNEAALRDISGEGCIDLMSKSDASQVSYFCKVVFPALAVAFNYAFYGFQQSSRIEDVAWGVFLFRLLEIISLEIISPEENASEGARFFYTPTKKLVAGEGNDLPSPVKTSPVRVLFPSKEEKDTSRRPPVKPAGDGCVDFLASIEPLA